MRLTSIAVIAGAISAVGNTSFAAETCPPPPTPIATVQCDANALRPTQAMIGMGEVKEREGKRNAVEETRNKHIIVVKGPGNTLYVVDHHHAVRMALDMNIPKLTCDILADYSSYSNEQFWAALEKKHWAYLKDEQGTPLSPKAMPESVADLRDDPYRTLAWHVRHHEHGYCKSSAPFAEFAWASFFRQKGIKPNDHEAALAAAKTCATAGAAELPGCKKSPDEVCPKCDDD